MTTMQDSTFAADLAYAGVGGQLAALRAGEITASALLEAQLARIATLEGDLRAFRMLDAEGARAAAAEADAARARGDDRPLLGVPLAIKDNANMAGLPTRHGLAGDPPPAGADAEGARAAAAEADAARARGDDRPLLGVPLAIKDNANMAGLPTRHGLAGDPPPAGADAEVVARLRAAGAVLVGKTNLPELAMWPLALADPERRTANPWDLERSPGGSSAGSAAAVAAGLVAGATATDGGGSIRVPASMCGLVGLKPTRGVVPLAPVEDHWHGATVAGVLTRTVEDTAVLLDVIADAPLAGDLPARVRREPGRLRVGVSVATALKPARADRAARESVARTVEALEALGHEVVEVKPPYGMPLGGMLPPYLHGVAEEAAALPGELSLERRSRRMVSAGRRYGERGIAKARRKGDAAYERMIPAWKGADVLLTPAVAAGTPRGTALERRGALATFLGVNPWIAYSAYWNWTGQPALSLPGGRDEDGLPRGVQLVGDRGADALLLSLGAQLERARPWAAERPMA
jgi:amidase